MSAAASVRSMPMWRALAVRDFRLLWSSEAVSVFGDQFHFIALSWLVIDLTRSGLALGTILIAIGVPRALMLLPFGVLADRRPPRNLMLVAHLGRGVVVGAIAALVLSETATLPLLAVLGAVFGVLDALYLPAQQSFLPRTVEAARLPSANSLLQGTLQLTTIVGPPLAGAFIVAFSTGAAFVVDSISFFVAAAIVLLISGKGAMTAGIDAAHEMADGAENVRRRRSERRGAALVPDGHPRRDPLRPGRLAARDHPAAVDDPELRPQRAGGGRDAVARRDPVQRGTRGARPAERRLGRRGACRDAGRRQPASRPARTDPAGERRRGGGRHARGRRRAGARAHDGRTRRDGPDGRLRQHRRHQLAPGADRAGHARARDEPGDADGLRDHARCRWAWPARCWTSTRRCCSWARACWSSASRSRRRWPATRRSSTPRRPCSRRPDPRRSPRRRAPQPSRGTRTQRMPSRSRSSGGVPGSPARRTTGIVASGHSSRAWDPIAHRQPSLNAIPRTRP